MNNFGCMIISNHIINVGFVAWASAQMIKTLLTFLKFKEFRAERLVGAGEIGRAHV